MKKHDINHPLWDVMNNLAIIQDYLNDEDSVLKDLIAKPCLELLDETLKKVESFYQKDIE